MRITAAQRDDFTSAVRSMIGTRFRHLGRKKETGVDCFGLLFCACRMAGIEIEDYIDYGREPDTDIIVPGLEKRIGKVHNFKSIDELMVSDVLIMSFGRGAQHIAIVAKHPSGGLSVINSDARGNKVSEYKLDERFASSIMAFCRFEISR